VRRLNIVRVIIPPRRPHAPRLDVIRDDFIAIRKRLTADAAQASLVGHLPGEQSLHLGRGSKLPITARMIGIFDAFHPSAKTPPAGIFLPAAAESGVVNGANLLLAQLHTANWQSVYRQLEKRQSAARGIGSDNADNRHVSNSWASESCQKQTGATKSVLKR
jgi:hypothetical protein